jgi:hypothetical protein
VSSRERKEEKKETQRCKGARTQRRKEVGGRERIAVKIAVKMQVGRQGGKELF